MHRGTWVAAALLAVVLAAGLLLALPQAPRDPGGPPESPVSVALAAEFRGGSALGGIDCSTCHYAFAPGFDVRADRTGDGPRVRYAVELAPASAYELAAVWAAPRAAGDGLPEPFTRNATLALPPVGPLRVPLELPWPAALVAAEAYSADTRAKPPFTLELVGPEGAVPGLGAPAVQRAVAVAGEAPLEGRWEAVVTPLDPLDGGRRLEVVFHAVPRAYEVRTDDGGATGTRGRPQGFTWDLPPPGRPGAPERFHVGVLAFNLHPEGNWSLPVSGDRAAYEGNVSASVPAAPAAPFTAEELAAPWAEGGTVLFHEHAFDGLIVRQRNARGERSGETLRTDLQECPPCDPPVYPAMPPGATHILASISWSNRDPTAPTADPGWKLAVTQRPEPAFRYPPPTETAPGQLVYLLPVSPEAWERGEEGWLQVWPLLSADAAGRTYFNGQYAFRVEVLRLPPDAAPAPT